jgi:quinol monooxygenase YgiN
MNGFMVRSCVAADRRREIRQLLQEATRVQESVGACLDSRVYEDVNDPERLLWVELWQDAKSLQSRTESDWFHGLFGGLECLGDIELFEFFETVEGSKQRTEEEE